MWARRLGVPHLWPSRVKVFVLGLMTAVAIFSVFQYLHGANVEYLDLERPMSREILCRLPPAECLPADDPVECTIGLEESIGHFWHALNLSSPCPLPPTSAGSSGQLSTQTCHNPSIPLSYITGHMASLRTVNGGTNHFRLWSILFLVLTSLLSVSIVVHDLALLEESLRPSILSMPNMKYASPCLWSFLSCTYCRHRMRFLRRRNRCLYWTCLVPVWTISSSLAFMVVMYPVSLLASFVAPVKMSRIMVFLSSIFCILWSVVFVVVTAGLDNQPYAVLWGSEPSDATGLRCVCLCEFPLSRDVSIRIVVLGLGVCVHSFSLALRALKGLRRAQWANMFSILYAVPIEAFPVVWERPADAGGGPVQWRCAGEAVQSEPAFDPFCLMDEQPESACTRLQLCGPVKMPEDVFQFWEPYTAALDTKIGCCGFPQPEKSEWTDDSDAEEKSGKAPEQPAHEAPRGGPNGAVLGRPVYSEQDATSSLNDHRVDPGASSAQALQLWARWEAAAPPAGSGQPDCRARSSGSLGRRTPPRGAVHRDPSDGGLLAGGAAAGAATAEQPAVATRSRPDAGAAAAMAGPQRPAAAGGGPGKEEQLVGAEGG